MKNLLLFTFLCIYGLVSAHSSDTIYYNRAEDKVNNLESAYRYSVKEKDTFRVYLRNGSLVLETYPIKIMRKRYRVSKAWYSNGSIKYEAFFKKWSTKYTLTSYWRNGRVRFEASGSIYGLDSSKCKAYSQLGKDTVFNIMNAFPQFPGGNMSESNFLNHNKIWNSSYRNDYVTIKFFVEKDGSVSGARVLNGIDPDLDKEALRLISNLPKWTPAMNLGENVRVELEYIFITPVTDSEICKDRGFRRGINKCCLVDYDD